MNERIEKFFEYGTDKDGIKKFYNSHYYIQLPEKIKSLQDCRNADKAAVSEIEHLQKLIEFLKAYRVELFERYQAINAANYHTRITIERQPPYYENKTFYYITVENVPDRDDVAPIRLRQDKFTGKERHTALKHFETLKKAYPNAEIIKNIEKKHWER